jgi:muconolactone delta-isomerase|tara:strand:- start:320 stop:604 length:285 start_codon:yes stop_codon:yes gene_type:complete
MLFAARLISQQPPNIQFEDWQAIVSEQLQATKVLRDEGKIRAIYRETGIGVLAIFETGDATEMDQILTQLPMAPYFKEVSVNVIWDMSPVLESL